MKTLLTLAVRLVRAIHNIYGKKWYFFGLFVLSFVASVWVLGRLDLLPNPPKPTVAPIAAIQPEAVETPEAAPVAVEELPVRISIPAIKMNVTIANPETTVIAELDKHLLKGAVRYPTSAKLGATGNVVVFGHSSYLPIVRNPAYKAFNDIQKLKAGDLVTVYSDTTAYTYKVRGVKKSTTEDGIPLAVDGKVLTLSTCNSFGEKSDRFVLTADFVESHPVAS